jgi:hypothetical protein
LSLALLIACSSGDSATDGGPPCEYAAKTTVHVDSATSLRSALAAARPGTKIVLADGTYSGQFSIAPAVDGTDSAPIILCGSRNAVLDQSGTGGYTLHLEADYWILSGFTVAHGQKAIMLDGANHNLLTGLDVRDAGMELLTLRCSSADNVVQDSLIHGSGKIGESVYGTAEGIYIGTAQGNCIATALPDLSDRNRVLRNQVYDVYAECIDIKENTTGGEIRGNTFDGNLVSGQNSADSWVDVKGNGYTVAENVGKNSSSNASLVDGFQTHELLLGWGNDNVFSGNSGNAMLSGYGVNATSATSGNVVGCDNSFPAAAKGASNVACTP